MLAGQVKICTTGPTGPVEKILSVDPCQGFLIEVHFILLYKNRNRINLDTIYNLFA